VRGGVGALPIRAACRGRGGVRFLCGRRTWFALRREGWRRSKISFEKGWFLFLNVFNIKVNSPNNTNKNLLILCKQMFAFLITV
jgi:hypothetical protein